MAAPFNPLDAAKIVGSAGVPETQAFICKYEESPALGVITDVHAAVTDDGTEQTITTSITNPDVPRVVSATAGGTATDIKAISCTIVGTDIAGNALTEVLPAFDVDTAGTKTGTKAFKTVTSITLPAHDGTGATTSFGTGAALGLAHKLTTNTVIDGCTSLNAVQEGTDATVTVSSTVVASNTISLSTALDGNVVVAYYLVDGND